MSDLGRKLREVLRDATNESASDMKERCAKAVESLKPSTSFDWTGKEVHRKPSRTDYADAIRALEE